MEASTRRPSFGDDCGLASIIVDINAPGYSGAFAGGNYHHPHSFLSRTVVPRRRGSIRNLASLSSFSGVSSCSSPRSGRVYDSRFEEVNNHPPHFLEACFLCKKQLGVNRDIFMYRGDTPFCSEECRQEQIDEDEAKEKKRNLSASVKAMRKKKDSSSVQNSPSSSPKARDYSYRAGTTAVAV